jgi:histidinol-phosphate/aromatic aminotransferase/cobyric acid decarboxylase-like protein
LESCNQAGDKVLILGQTFGEYERAIRLMAAMPQYLNTLPTASFAFNVPEITRRLVQPISGRFF